MLVNPCQDKGINCVNCHSHFSSLRPGIKEYLVSKHFLRDLKKKDFDMIVNEILSCDSINYFEMHKFEGNIEGNFIFRAKKEKLHLVYAVDKKKRLVFLRAVKNFKEYTKFLQNRKEILSLINSI